MAAVSLAEMEERSEGLVAGCGARLCRCCPSLSKLVFHLAPPRGTVDSRAGHRIPYVRLRHWDAAIRWLQCRMSHGVPAAGERGQMERSATGRSQMARSATGASEVESRRSSKQQARGGGVVQFSLIALIKVLQ